MLPATPSCLKKMDELQPSQNPMLSQTSDAKQHLLNLEFRAGLPTTQTAEVTCVVHSLFTFTKKWHFNNQGEKASSL